ncbi:MAG: peptidoglycan editing factor PgeF [Psychromonas sp.]
MVKLHSELGLIKPSWSAPSNIQAVSTTRLGGCSLGIYQGLNLGAHVQDDPQRVDKNRFLLSETLSLPNHLPWLNQTHSTSLLYLDNSASEKSEIVAADAAWTVLENQPCVVMTADCLPLLITNKQGSFVAAIHAGWRGLCDGIIEKSITSICNQLNLNSNDLFVWLGPCIGKSAFAVGDEVRAEFIAENAKAQLAFSRYEDRWLADLQQLARLRLAAFDIFEITASEHCTFSESDLFYSYRREGVTGRMASLIWIE